MRRERLARALADFDSATIATTHGFCQEVLGGLGVLGDIGSDTTFVEDISDLRGEVVDDLYLRRFGRRGDRRSSPARRRWRSRRRRSRTRPRRSSRRTRPTTPIAAMRVRLAGAARNELDARKRRMGVMTYDDLLTRLSDTLAGEGGDVAARAPARPLPRRARRRVPGHRPRAVADHATAFGDGETTLVLIGDPKQAIYAFRGADVYAYIEAAQTAGAQATLTINWRSDQGLIDAYDALFGGAKLGHEGIVYRQVTRPRTARRACTARRTRRRCGSGSCRATTSA